MQPTCQLIIVYLLMNSSSSSIDASFPYMTYLALKATCINDKRCWSTTISMACYDKWTRSKSIGMQWLW